MKTFEFRLSQALRWREEQANLQKSRLSAAAGSVMRANAALESCKAQSRNAAAAIKLSPDGAALSAYAGFAARSRARLRDLERQKREAEAVAAVEMSRLIEANRGVRLLEKLRDTQQIRWRRAFDRETETFAGEAFLHRLQSRKETK